MLTILICGVFLFVCFLQDVTVTEVAVVLGTGATIRRGVENELTVDLHVSYLVNSEATSVSGQGLWMTSMWVSNSGDGSNALPGSVVEDILTEAQQSQDLRKDPSNPVFSIEGIRYRFDMSHHKCQDVKFICATFNKGPDPKLEQDYLEYHFTATPTEEVLTGCTAIETCIDGKPVL